MKKLLKKIIPDWILGTYHFKLAFFGALIYGWPSRKLKVIGVTGTKGKSTVVMLAGKVLEEKFSTSSNNNPSTGSGNTNPPQPSFTKGGSKIGWISSLTINDGQKEVMNPYHMTMPGRFFIQKTLAQMVKNGCEYALVEVTSEGIKQYRHKFIDFFGAVFTNLAPEHLETHGGFANYRATKEKLFAATAKNPDSFGVYNLDDENVGEFLKYPAKNKIGYYFSIPKNPPDLTGQASSKNKNIVLFEQTAEGGASRTLQVSDINLNSSGSEFEINGVQFKTNLLGEFNVYNCAAAVATGQACGVSLESAAQTLRKIQSIPGRLEIINEGQDFTVVVDLAHTPDSFEKVFKLFNEFKKTPHPRKGAWPPRRKAALRPRRSTRGFTPNPLPALPAGRLRKERGTTSKIISVFGSAGGGRDKWKRPELGRIASENSDRVIICNEDPYDESPKEICQEIAAGCKNTKPEIIPDRRQAIARALSLAQARDIVLILGKGTEQAYVEGNKKTHWDDRVVAREELKNLHK